jgi:hypothetical protein
LVFVVKLAAVLNASSGDTGPSFCGLNGSTCCSRWIAYVTTRPKKLKRSIAVAYPVHLCSRCGSTPHAR